MIVDPKAIAALAYVVSRFTYRPDPKWNDRWDVMQGADMQGDCDDFALTVAHRICGSRGKVLWWVLTRRLGFHMCRTKSGELHLYLEYQGYKAENIYRSWSKELPFSDMFRVPAWLVLLKLFGTPGLVVAAVAASLVLGSGGGVVAWLARLD